MKDLFKNIFFDDVRTQNPGKSSLSVRVDGSSVLYRNSQSIGRRVAQYIKRKTKQIKKQTVLNLLHGPRKVFYCVLFFPPAGLLAVTYNDT